MLESILSDNKHNPVDYETEFAEISTTGAETIHTPAKLVITKTQVLGRGDPSADNPANARYYYNPSGEDAPQDDYLSSEVTLLRQDYYSVSGCRLTRPVSNGVTIIREVYGDGSVRSYKTQRQ